MVKKFYGFTFKGGPLAAQKPLAEEDMLRQIDESITSKYNIVKITEDDFQIYELVPVKIVIKRSLG